MLPIKREFSGSQVSEWHGNSSSAINIKSRLTPNPLVGIDGPYGTLTITAKGAGGGGTANTNGGSGGITTGSYLYNFGKKLTIVVGQGGSYQAANAGPGIRPTGNGGLVGVLGYGGCGGGYSGVFEGAASWSNALIVAAGGGGASWESGGSGGAGGGLSGSAGGNGTNAGGGGGTQSAPGSTGAGTLAAGKLLGGDVFNSGDGGGGGGGGAGYYGGGAGDSSSNGSGGGGGSSYYSPSLITSGSTTSGGGANGGTGANAGSDGSVIVSYADTYPDLIVSANLTYSMTNSGGLKTYTFTSGAGSIVAYSYADTTDNYTNTFSPLWGHYDASIQSGYVLNSGSVSQWTDLGPRGNHLTQSNSAYRPKIYCAASKSGLDVLRLDGINKSLSSAATMLGSPATFIFAIRYNNLTTYRTIFDGMYNNSANLVGINGNALAFYSSGWTSLSLPISIGTWYINAIRLDGTNTKAFSTPGSSSAGSDDGVSMGGFRLGLGDSVGPEDGNFDIGELFIFSVALTDSEISSLMSTLAIKWGVA